MLPNGASSLGVPGHTNLLQKQSAHPNPPSSQALLHLRRVTHRALEIEDEPIARAILAAEKYAVPTVFRANRLRGRSRIAVPALS